MIYKENNLHALYKQSDLSLVCLSIFSTVFVYSVSVEGNEGSDCKNVQADVCCHQL